MSFVDNPSLRARIFQMAAQADQGQGGNGPLKGQEAQRLRNFYTTNCMEPSRDLDYYGGILSTGRLDAVKEDFEDRIIGHLHSSSSREEAKKKAADELYALKWGPTQIIQFMKWLVDEAKVPVDGRDLLGSTAIHITLATKPGFDPEIAQILYDAGADVNTRNRAGANAVHESTMICEPQNAEKMRTAATAIDWFLTHGGSLDIKDNDGCPARINIDQLHSYPKQFQKNLAPIFAAVERSDRRRAKLGETACTLCATVPRGDKKLLTCSKCKSAKYCAPPKACQKLDWPRHKGACKAMST